MINGVYTFPKGISPKVNVIAWLEFELAYYDVKVQHVNHYATRAHTPPVLDRNICYHVNVCKKKLQKKSKINVNAIPEPRGRK